MIVTGLFSRHKSAHFGEHVSDTHECEHQCECVPALVSFQATLHSHTPATRRKHALSFSLSLGLELWVKGGRDVELAFNSMWVESKRLKRFGIVDHFEKLQLKTSSMSFSDFDCADNIL